MHISGAPSGTADLALRQPTQQIPAGRPQPVVAFSNLVFCHRMSTGPHPVRDTLNHEFFGLGLERLLGRNDLIDVGFLERGYRAARAVGRITIRSAGGDLEGFGTGFSSPRGCC